MLTTARSLLLAVLALTLAGSAVKGADTYTLDPVHSSNTFMIEHMGISYVHGRFNEMSGTITLDKADPAKSSIMLTLKAESVDTNQKARDTHLRSPDFFDAKQFPLLSFQSTSVKPAKDGYDVTGNFTMHGVKKAISFNLMGGKTLDFKGQTKIGFHTMLDLHRADFRLGAPMGLGDEVKIYIGMEAVKK